jgi:thiamine kinase-like enzyme
MLLEKGPIEVPGYDELRAQAIHARVLAEADGAPKCLTHNDFFNLNLLYGEDGALSLIDWEYAGMSDYASDYGTFVVTCMLDDAEAERALELYYGRKPTLEEKRHNYVFVGLAGWCWYIWSLQKESEGDFVGEWLYIYYKYAKKYLPLAISLYEKQ